MAIDWIKVSEDASTAIFNWADAVRLSFGLGGGVGFIKLLAHIPAPRLGSMIWGTVFDVLCDLVNNNRIGERRDAAGKVIFVVKPPRPKEIPDPAPEVPTETPADKSFVADKSKDKTDDKVSDKIIRPAGLN